MTALKKRLAAFVLIGLVPAAAFGMNIFVPPNDIDLGAMVQAMLDGSGRAVALGAGSQDVTGSKALSTSAADIWAAATSFRQRAVLMNTDYATSSGGSGIVAWCRWGTAAGAPAAAHGVGSFPLFPGGGIDISGAGTPQAALNCIAERGTPVI